MKKRPLCLMCIGLMTAILLMKAAGIPIFGEPARMSEIRPLMEAERTVHVTGRIYRREKTAKAVRYYLKNTFLSFHNQQIPLNKIYIMTQETDRRPVGALVEVSGILEQPERPGNPGQFDAASYYACQKIYFSMWADSVKLLREPEWRLREDMARFRERLTSAAAELVPEAQAGVLAAMLWGDKSLLTDETEINYQFGGIMHVISISGLHVSLMGLGIYRLLQRLVPRKIPAAVSAAVCMLLYCLFAGAQVATVRAFVMFAAGLGARVSGRSYDMPCALALSGILILLENPGYLFFSGFQLSFTAVLGVGIVSPAFLRLLPEQKPGVPVIRRRLRRLSETLLSCGVIWAVTLPLSAYWFYELPLWGSLVNLLVLPAMGPVMGFGAAGCAAGLFLPELGKILLFPASVLLAATEELMKLLRFLPGGLWICGQPEIWQAALSYAAIGMAVLWIRREKQKKKKRINPLPAAAVPAVLCALLLIRQRPDFSVTALDVGQGDCLSVQAGSCFFLVDGGSSDETEVGRYRILPYLKQQGIGHLEGIFITHPDADHTGGILEILRAAAARETQLSVKNLMMPAWMEETESGHALAEAAEAAGAAVRYLKAGDAVRSGNCRIEVLYPTSGTRVKEGEENSGSLVLGVHFGNFDGLLTGDLEGEGEQELLGTLTECDYLKVAHHGSGNSTGSGFLEKVRPSVCVISAPERSIYGHPHPEVLERIEKSGGKIFRTSSGGAVRLVTDGDRMEVFTFLK